MIGGDEGHDPGTMGNRYCDRLGLASVPCVEDLLRKKEVTLFHLLVAALLERGAPMSVEELGQRLTDAGVVARSGDLVLALKQSWHGREPVCRDPDGRLALNLSSSEVDRMLWQACLRPPHFQAPPPPPDPAQPGDEAPLAEDELTAAFHERSLYSFSAHRQAAAVLDVRGQSMTVEEVEGILAGMTRYRFPFAADRVRYWRSSLVTLDTGGRLVLDRHSPDLGVMRRAVRKLARPVLIQRARHEHWATVREERELVLAHERQRQAQEVAQLHRAVVRAVPEAGMPAAFSVLDVGSHSIRTFVGGELAAVSDLLAEFDLLIGLHVRETLHGLGLDPDRWRLVDLKPPQKSRRINRQGRTLEISPEWLIASTTGISRPLGDPAKIAQSLAEAKTSTLTRRLESDVKALWPFYQYGVLHRSVRLRWGFRDEILAVDWALPGEPSLYDMLQESKEAGVPVDLVIGSAPGWTDPWSRARRGWVLQVFPIQIRAFRCFVRSSRA